MTTVYFAGDHDHEIQDTPCDWCDEPLGQGGHVYGTAGVTVYHASPCWDEVNTEQPAEVETFADRAAVAYDEAVGW